MKIPFNDLTSQYLMMKQEIEDAISSVLLNGKYIMDRNVRSFEAEFAEYCGVKYGIGVASGTDAIFISLTALGIGEGDEVITVSMTALPTISAILQTGAKPIFVDVDIDTHTIDPEKLDKAITSNTKAIIPVHLYGMPCEMNSILQFARKNNLFVIEDCCQAHGAEYNGRKVGTFGNLACFSFYPTKNLGAYGDGGIVLTNCKELNNKIREMRNYGRRIDSGQMYILGINSRLDELQAAILRKKLHFLDKWNQKRIRIATEYIENIENNYIKTPITPKNRKHVFHLFVVQTKHRNFLIKYLNQHGIEALIHSGIPVHLEPLLNEDVKYSNLQLPVTEQLSRIVLSIPLHPMLSESDIGFICKTINGFSGER